MNGPSHNERRGKNLREKFHFFNFGAARRGGSHVSSSKTRRRWCGARSNPPIGRRARCGGGGGRRGGGKAQKDANWQTLAAEVASRACARARARVIDARGRARSLGRTDDAPGLRHPLCVPHLALFFLFLLRVSWQRAEATLHSLAHRGAGQASEAASKRPRRRMPGTF